MSIFARQFLGMHLSLTVLAGLMLCASLSPRHAHAQDGDALIGMVNAYRAAPESCNNRPAEPAGPLAPHPALSGIRLDADKDLQRALDASGYAAARAEVMKVEGPSDPASAMAALRKSYCQTLLSRDVAAIGASRTGNSWLVVLARPLLAANLGDWRHAGKAILQAVNAARAQARHCGKQAFPAAPALTWNDALADAALAHSRAMAKDRFFSHKGRDGSQASDRALRAGYTWRRVGENIATGQGSPEEVVAGWLSSPGHCANIMHRDFREMGAAYAMNAQSDTKIYWTQVFGTPR
jgi:uncharacterized protein YkwD